MELNLERINREWGHEPQRLVDWGIGLGRKAICTTSFGPFSAVILHMVTRADPAIPVVWIDSGYGTPAMYRYADAVTRLLKLQLHIYRPRRSRAHRDAVDGPPPAIDDPRHAEFTRELKLEPFERVTRELKPQVWFTAIRADETPERARMQPVSVNPDGLIKIAPVLHWTSKQMNDYLKQYRLPNNFDYFDPTKVEDQRECGLHIAH
ncbi:MAG: phosphoadenosine phosphosulfate reductase family protein [Nevskiales bacterium]|nr:phosphoadenosine phosphosulfate reductase family protein [Nevskiales bacterium]